MLKRRLTYHTFLDRYARLLKIMAKCTLKPIMKTCLCSLEEFKIVWELKNVTHDLHSTDLPNVKTEYEEKFSAKGQPIFRLEAVNRLLLGGIIWCKKGKEGALLGESV